MFTIVDVNSKFWIQTRVVIYGLSGKVSRYALCMAGSVNLIRAPAPVPSHSLALMKFLIKGRYSASLGLARDPSWDSRRPAQIKAACRAGLDDRRASPLSRPLVLPHKLLPPAFAQRRDPLALPRSPRHAPHVISLRGARLAPRTI